MPAIQVIAVALFLSPDHRIQVITYKYVWRARRRGLALRAATPREQPLRTVEPGGGPFGIVACSGTFSLAMARIEAARQLPDQSTNSLGGIFLHR
jgi:hypothetical protein